MKFIKLDDPVIDQIIVDHLDHIGILNDEDNLSINDEIEFFNNSNVVFGRAYVKKSISQYLNDIDDVNVNIVGDKNDNKREVDLLKIIYFDFKVYDEPRKLITNIELDVETIKIYADGGSRGNPGPSASGYVLLTKDNQIIKQNGVYLGSTTNNRAEYMALLFALKDAVDLNSQKVTVYMDSLLVINQMRGVYKIKNADLIPIHREINSLLVHFDRISFNHVPRELNKLADLEVNKCLDLIGSL
jgi:ribonuclease HI